MAVASSFFSEYRAVVSVERTPSYCIIQYQPADDGKGYIVCLHNMGKQSVCSSFVWGSIRPREVSVCDYRQKASDLLMTRCFG